MPSYRPFALAAGLAALAFLGGLWSRHGGFAADAPVPEEIGGKYGYVDGRGRIIIAPRFDGADTFSEGLAVVLDSGRFGYIDSRGAMAIPALYRHARAFHGGFATVRLGDRWLTLDRSGRTLPSPAPVVLSQGQSASP